MNDNNSIASIYNIVENIEYFEAEQLYLVTTKDDLTKQYWLQHIDLRNRSAGEVKLIKDIISTIKSLSSQQFEQEQFPNLIDIIEVENTVNLVYSKIAGRSLKTKLKNLDSLAEIEIIQYLQNLLTGLKLIHDRGLVHRMIKPQNLTLTNHNQQITFNNYGKVTTDSYSSLMATMSFEDTRYITQEQLKGKANFSSDIYALGMVVITSIIGIDIASLEENDSGGWDWNQNQNFSDRFIQLIDKMTHRKTRLRYQNVDEVLATIKQYFPELENKQIPISESDYTRTQIISIEPEKKEETLISEPIKEENISSPPLNLDVTQIIETESEHKENIDNHNNIESINNQSIIETEEKEKLIKIETEDKQNIPLFENIEKEESLLSSNLEIDQFNNESNLRNNLESKAKTTQRIIASLIFIVIVILGINFYSNYRYQKQVENIINQIKTYYQNDQFNDCITLINSSETQSLPIGDTLTKEFLGKCWLGLAESQALQRNFVEAITIAVKVNNKSPDYDRARKFINDWSEQLFKEAKIICENGGDIAEANQRLDSIPQSSVWKKEALNLIAKCPNLFTPEEDTTTLDSNSLPNGVVEICPGPLCPE